MSGLLVEVVCEELPARFVATAAEQLETGVRALLAGLSIGASRRYGTPRRIAVAIDDVPPARPRTERTVLGPPAERATNPDGTFNAAAVGFAKGKGLDPSALRVEDGPKGRVVAVTVVEGGEPTAARLAAALPELILGIQFPKTMVWGEGNVRWGRPLHRVNVVLHGVVVAGEVAGIAFGNTTVGHRRAQSTEFSFASEAEWLSGLRARAVEPDAAIRRGVVSTLVAEADTRMGTRSPVDPELLDEVTNLVEAPTLVIGQFDPSLRDLPARLLVQSMKVHQRYFPLWEDGRLSNHFVHVSNNPWGEPELVARGAARVLAARFDDAKFFLREDRAVALAEQARKLDRMRWIRGLGTMADKSRRLRALALALAPRLGADPAVVGRAADLAKADLVTKMVGEFPELQGHMGRLYAEGQGEDPAAALAIEEHWLPRNAGDDPPSSPAGATLALADRLDTLVGCFGIGLRPSSGGDPQGLRRAASGLLAILLARGVRVELGALFDLALDVWRAAPGGPEWKAPASADLVEFALTRFKASEVGEGATADLVDAAVSGAPADPVALSARVAALRALAGNPEFGSVLAVFKRVLNITKGADFPAPDRAALTHDAERALAAAIGRIRGQVATAVDALDFSAALDGVLELQGPVASLFDAVMVDSPVASERAARLGLLGELRAIFNSVADFSRISTR